MGEIYLDQFRGKMPFSLAGSEKNAVLPDLGFRDFYMFAADRLWV